MNHRGVTHSLILLPLWSLGVAWLLAKLLREPAGWRALYGITALSIGAHIAGDVITSYGTMVLAPLSDWRAGIGTTFIIDLWFSCTRYGEVEQAAAREAWTSEVLGFFRWFAAQPAFDGTSDGASCVWFVDLRFVTPGRDVTPFQFGACRESGVWRGYQRAGPASKVLLR